MPSGGSGISSSITKAISSGFHPRCHRGASAAHLFYRFPQSPPNRRDGVLPRRPKKSTPPGEAGCRGDGDLDGDFDLLGEGSGAFRGRNVPGRMIRGRIVRPTRSVPSRVGVAGFGGMKSAVASENHLIAEAIEGKAPGVPNGEFRSRPKIYAAISGYCCEPSSRHPL